MDTNLLSETELIDQAHARGCTDLTHWKIERWHKEDVIPRPVVIEHLGYPQGNRSYYAPQALDQLLAAYRLLQKTRNFAMVRFQLWQAGFPIPFDVLRNTFRQLVPLLKWNIPRGDERRYRAVVRRQDDLLGKFTPRLTSSLFKLFGMKLERFKSLMETQLYLFYGMEVSFRQSHAQEGEPSLTDLFAQSTGLEEMRFFSSDLTDDLQRMADQELFSIPRMNAALERATEEDLRRAHARAEVFPLLFAWLEVMEILPKALRSLMLRAKPDPCIQAAVLLFALRLEEHGYAENTDALIEALRVQVPRMRAFQAIFPEVQREFPDVAQAFGSPAAVWREFRHLPESEHEAFFARKQERLRVLYQQHKEELDAFWQRHSEVTALFDEPGESSTLSQPKQESA